MGQVKKKILTNVKTLSATIRTFREQLGESQEGLARQLGCSLAVYRKWEAGSRTPRRDWLLKMLALCPEDEMRAQFGVEFETLRPQKSLHGARELTDEQEERLRHYNDAATGINILYEAAEAGHAGADEALRDLADRINKRAGDWRRMKYLKR